MKALLELIRPPEWPAWSGWDRLIYSVAFWCLFTLVILGGWKMREILTAWLS